MPDEHILDRIFNQCAALSLTLHGAAPTTMPTTPYTPGSVIRMQYTNYRGETAIRVVRFTALVWGSTEWHPEPQWLINAWDLDKGEPRLFALKDAVVLN